MPQAFLTSNKQDYATPWPLIEALEKELGRRFTLDVCATENSAKAPKFYTGGINAFTQPWAMHAGDGLAFCNPPYVDGWPLKFLVYAEVEANLRGLTTVFLLPANKVDQHWWHYRVMPYHSIWTVLGRVNFLDPETGLVPKIWKEADDPIGGTGKWIKQSNPQASKIVIVGPGFGPCLPRSFVWK